MRKQKIKFPVKLAVTAIIFLIILFIAGRVIVKLENLSFFSIKDIVSKDGNIAELSNLKGRNIFSVDLAKVSSYILEKSPDYKKVRIIRVLPDRLYVDFVKRSPSACVKLYRFFYVDSDCVFFNPPDLLFDQNLAVITGLETKIFAPRPGSRYNIKELKAALDIIREIKNIKAFADYPLKKIDLADFVNTTIFLALPQPAYNAQASSGTGDFLEVKIGPDHIGDKINILSSLLSQVTSERFNIKYIDLRFKEPVIKLKETVKNK